MKVNKCLEFPYLYMFIVNVICNQMIIWSIFVDSKTLELIIKILLRTITSCYFVINQECSYIKSCSMFHLLRTVVFAYIMKGTN